MIRMKVTLDLGGTNIRTAVVDGSTVLNKSSVPCRANDTEQAVIEQIIASIEPLVNDKTDGIGIGVPSVVDPREGIVYNAANIPSWRKVPLKSILEQRFNLPVRVNNDCNCFALGEHRYCAGRGLRDMVGITLGTGVGSGLILDGRLYSGVLCGAGEVGSLPYLDSDFEHYCSSLWLRDAHNTTGAELAQKANAGDKKAIALWHKFGENLGELTKAILFAYAPEAIVIGGGIAAAMPLFRAGWESTVMTFPYPRIAQGCRMIQAELPDANLIGAALLFED